MPEVKTLGRAFVVDFPTGEKLLYGVIDIDCQECGVAQISIPGHHMRSILRLLAEWVEMHPELTGPTEIKEVERMHTEFVAPGGDPNAN